MEANHVVAPKNDAERQHRRDNDHFDASAGVDGVEAFYEQCVANGVTIIKSITASEWGTKGFYVEDRMVTSSASAAARRQATTGLHATAYLRFAAHEPER